MNLNEIIKQNWWVYTVCLVSILICMVYWYNIEDYQAKNDQAYIKFIKECNCQCLIDHDIPKFNITPEFNVPIYHEIVEEKQDANTT